TEPVETAMNGMLSTLFWPSFWRVGRRVCCALSGSSVQAVTGPTITMRRHLPSWMTTGNDTPAGTLFNVNVPSVLLVVDTSGLPLAVVLHWSHATVPATPAVIDVTPY